VINHNIMRLNIAMHNPLAMAEVQCLQQFEDIVPYVKVDEAGVERPKIGIIDEFEDETRRFALTVADHIQQRNDIWATRQVLQDLDLALYLLLFDRFQDLDDAFLVVDDIDPFENF
jgi:hypothetical protein